MKIVIIKYNSGNVRSVDFALQRLGIDATWTDDKNEIMSADKVIFPGVGHAAAAMRSLREAELDRLIPHLKQPFLGICAGMQLMCAHSEEGNTDCLNIFRLRVKRFPDEKKIKIPHTGWNTICSLKTELFDGIEENEYMYFVHSYFVETGKESIALSEYGATFSSAIRRDNFFGIQFHAELSAGKGSRILSNFLKLK